MPMLIAVKEAAKTIIATHSTGEITEMLIANVREMQSLDLGSNERAVCFYENLWFAEVLEDRIGVKAVEQIENDLWKGRTL